MTPTKLSDEAKELLRLIGEPNPDALAIIRGLIDLIPKMELAEQQPTLRDQFAMSALPMSVADDKVYGNTIELAHKMGLEVHIVMARMAYELAERCLEGLTGRI